MENWLSANANLLSGLAALVTLVGVVLPLLLHRQYGLGALALRMRGKPSGDQSAAAATAPLLPAATAPGGPGSIAVMAFDDLSGDAGDTHIADGISCELIAALSRAVQLRLAPRADSFALRGQALSLAEIGRRLGVRYVVHGSVRQSANRLRIIAEFADTATGRQLWSKTYDRDLTDVLKVQEEIAAAVASSLGGAAYRAEVINAQPATQNVDAWSLTQKARQQYMTAADPATKEKALERVREALRIDSGYALANALLAHLLMDKVTNGQAGDVPRVEAEARAAIEQALHGGSDQADVLFYAGVVWLELGERERSESALRRGIRRSPHDLMQWGSLARTLGLGTTANAEESVRIVDRITELAPEHPVAWTWELYKGLACMNLGRYEEARTLFQGAAQAAPKFVRAQMLLACAAGASGDPEGARAAAARARQINGSLTADRFAAYIRKLAGNPDTAARITLGLARAELLSGTGAVPNPAAARQDQPGPPLDSGTKA